MNQGRGIYSGLFYSLFVPLRFCGYFFSAFSVVRTRSFLHLSLLQIQPGLQTEPKNHFPFFEMTRLVPILKNNLFFFAIMLIAMFLRLAWTSDMEWKEDEKLMYSMAHEAVEKNNLPVVGMGSGQGIPNPGMSVW